MKLTSKEAKNVVWEEADGWEPVTEESIIDQKRWVTVVERVFRHIDSGKTFNFVWERGSTECQEQQPYEYDDFYEPVEVVEKEVVVKQWIEAKSLKGE